MVVFSESRLLHENDNRMLLKMASTVLNGIGDKNQPCVSMHCKNTCVNLHT